MLNWWTLLERAVVIAGLASFTIQSPVNLWLRRTLAGAPDEAEIERWRQGNLTGQSPSSEPPRAERPIVDEGLQCPPCVAFWATLFVLAAPTVTSFLAPWAFAWLAGRLVYGLVTRADQSA